MNSHERITSIMAATASVLLGCSSLKDIPSAFHKTSNSTTATSNASSTTTSADATNYSCSQPKTPAQFMTTLAQDLFRREPTPTELAMVATPGYSNEATVQWAFTQGDYDTGLAYFISNLLRLDQNLTPPANDTGTDVALLADLTQEPVLLIQANKGQPWADFFTTQDFFCSALTAPLYDFPVDPNISGFVSCKMPPERAGILGLVSTLRAFSSAYFTTNSNRHRVAMALYLAQGLQLAAKTNGPTGTGRPLPLAACVPEIDTRVSSTGEVFGTAAVPKVGSVCAGCHTPYLAPMEPAFLRFGLKGELLNISDIPNFPNSMTNGISKEVLADIMQYGNESCWNPLTQPAPPQEYTGLPGLARLIASSSDLGQALSVQIQQNLVNQPVDTTTSNAIMESYQANGQTLQAALQGFFLSAPYQCAVGSGG